MALGIRCEIAFHGCVVVADTGKSVAKIVHDTVVQTLFVVREVFLHGGTEETVVCCVVAVAGVADAGEITGEDLLLEGIYGVGNSLQIIEYSDVLSNGSAESAVKLSTSWSAPRNRKTYGP